MIKKFDYSIKMAEDIILIDKESFKNITYNPDEICKKIKNNTQYELYVYYKNNIPLGYLGLLYVSNLHYDGAWIDLIAIRNIYMNKGYGRELLKFAEEEVKVKKLELLTALVKNNNFSSMEMFNKSGFHSDSIKFSLFEKSIL